MIDILYFEISLGLFQATPLNKHRRKSFQINITYTLLEDIQ